MQFNALHKLHFSCADGAYSIVTPREIYDSQITLTDNEAALVISAFGRDQIQRGNVKSDKIKALKPFKLQSGGLIEDIELNLVFPKPERDELRLYLKASVFKPAPNDIWFLYPKDGKIRLGSMTENEWRSIGRNDDDDASYQKIIEIPEIKLISPEYQLTAAKITQKRNPLLAKKRFELADYLCEMDHNCRLFRSRSNGENYLEAHHFIPLAFQPLFEQSLDVTENIIALCPFCHRAIHHADVAHTRSLVHTLASSRNTLFEQFGITTMTLYDFYNCEDIVA